MGNPGKREIMVKLFRALYWDELGSHKVSYRAKLLYSIKLRQKPTKTVGIFII